MKIPSLCSLKIKRFKIFYYIYKKNYLLHMVFNLNLLGINVFSFLRLNQTI